MNEAELNKLIPRIAEGHADAYLPLQRQIAPYCIKELIKRANLSQEQAEAVWIDALLFFRDQVLQQRLPRIRDVQEYFFLTCWEMLRQRRQRERQRERSEHTGLREQLYELLFRNVSREQADAVWRKPEHYYTNLYRAAQNALQQLPAKEQRLLQMYYLDKQPLEWIAKKLNLSPATDLAELKSQTFQSWIDLIQQELTLADATTHDNESAR